MKNGQIFLVLDVKTEIVPEINSKYFQIQRFQWNVDTGEISLCGQSC